jgi:hypothetical protein
MRRVGPARSWMLLAATVLLLLGAALAVHAWRSADRAAATQVAAPVSSATASTLSASTATRAAAAAPSHTPTVAPTASHTPTSSPTASASPSATVTPTVTPTQEPTALPALPQKVALEGFAHEWQTWNNCGPAALAIGLSYFGVQRTQAEIAASLHTDPADKNVSLDELLRYAAAAAVSSRTRVNGHPDLLHRLNAAGIPVLTEGWLRVGEDIGHYRVVSGYDLEAGALLTQDSYHGADVRVSEVDFVAMWQPFFFAYAPLYRADQEALVASIIGPDWDDAAMAAHALADAEMAVQSEPDNAYVWHNLGDARSQVGEWDAALDAYETALGIGLPSRFFWYHFGYFTVLNQAGRHARVLELTAPLVQETPSLAEVLVQRGHALHALDRTAEAIAAFEQALPYIAYREELSALLEDLREGQ